MTQIDSSKLRQYCTMMAEGHSKASTDSQLLGDPYSMGDSIYLLGLSDAYKSMVKVLEGIEQDHGV